MDEQTALRVLRCALHGQPLPSIAASECEALASWAYPNRVASFVREAAGPDPDSPLARALAAFYRREAASAMLREQRVPPLLAALESEGAPAIAFKGLGAAHRYYSRPDLRPLGDLDLLFRPEHMDAAERAALALGFAPQFDDPAVVEFERNEYYTRSYVHPQTGLFEAHYGFYRDVPDAADREVLDGVEPIEIWGAPARICAAHHLWPILAVHLVKSPAPRPLCWLLDLALMVRHPKHAPGWGECLAFCERHGLQVFAAAASALLGPILDAAPPKDFCAAVESSLTRRERDAVRPVAEGGLAACAGDRVCMARRLSGRPVRGRHGVWGSLWPHPGAVCRDLNVRSDAPFFFWHRARHVVQRLVRGLRGMA